MRRFTRGALICFQHFDLLSALPCALKARQRDSRFAPPYPPYVYSLLARAPAAAVDPHDAWVDDVEMRRTYGGLVDRGRVRG